MNLNNKETKNSSLFNKEIYESALKAIDNMPDSRKNLPWFGLPQSRPDSSKNIVSVEDLLRVFITK